MKKDVFGLSKFGFQMEYKVIYLKDIVRFMGFNFSELSKLFELLGITQPVEIRGITDEFHGVILTLSDGNRVKLYIGDILDQYPYVEKNKKKYLLEIKSKKIVRIKEWKEL